MQRDVQRKWLPKQVASLVLFVNFQPCFFKAEIHLKVVFPPPNLRYRRPSRDDFFAIFLDHAKLNITNLTTFLKTNYLKILKCARVIHKNVFSNKILLPARAHKPIRTCQRAVIPVTFFAAISNGVLDFKTLSFLLFTLASCDKFYHNKSYARFPLFFDPLKKERLHA